MPRGKHIAYIITNFAPDEILSQYANISGDIYAVDQGLHKVHALGLKPSYIIGDFDSVEAGLLMQYEATPILRHHAMKDETDTELALQFCLDRGQYKKIVICNDMQGRFDHALAIVQNLAWLHSLGMAACIENATQRIFFLDDYTVLQVAENTLLSLIPWAGEACFESSSGLAYPLQNLCIKAFQSRGISNVCSSSTVEIGLKSGKVLAVLTIF